MQAKRVKYSIIIPVKNSLKYLPECIYSIIRQDYLNYELIISDDHSEDGTVEYLNTLHHQNIKIIHPPKHFTVTEHYDFAIRNVTGEWLICVGSDDGLQPYFFKLADILTDIAVKNNIRAIGSRRAYYYWDGCQEVWGNSMIRYSANLSKKYKIKYSKFEIIKTLLGYRDSGYHSLPQMYTTSLFHHSLIDEAKKKQNGKILTAAFPDVNLAIISTTIEKKFIESNIPFGWVGTSPRSVFRDENILRDIRKTPFICGNFDLMSKEIWFWGYLLTLSELRDIKTNKIIASKLFISLMFGNILSRMILNYIFKRLKKEKFVLRKKLLYEVIQINKCYYFIIIFIVILLFLPNSLYFFFKLLNSLFYKLSSKMGSKTHLSLRLRRTKNKNITMTDASNRVLPLIKSIFEKKVTYNKT
ncbi:MAG: glycosyltransferase [Bacteroidales bacterium]|jgi:glycosyltransferase involved in cell wall biosynthesis|nr:glycosyltransferase [Bacteroidales bacterium]